MSKLNQLAEAAADYFDVSFEVLKGKSREAIYTKPRHICQWVALDAGYTKPVVARYWNVDRTAVYYGQKIVGRNINVDAKAMKELKAFMRFAGGHMAKKT
jgi:chromosomal replication initiation ATPase DnaA